MYYDADQYIDVLIMFILFVMAPFIGCVTMGVFRKLLARFHNRIGPPIRQPWYDFLKLIGKKEIVMNHTQLLFLLLYLFFVMSATAFLIIGQDLIIIFFTLSAGEVFFVLSAYSVRSTFSNIGGSRQLIQVLSVEPVFLLVIFTLGLVAGSYEVTAVSTFSTPLILVAPFSFIALIMVVLVFSQKSPFDVATADQEIIKGPISELSGQYLAMAELAHWYEMFLFMYLFSLFVTYGNIFISYILKVLLVVIVLFVIVWIDASSARYTWRRLAKVTLITGTALNAINIAVIVLLRWGGVAL